MKSVFPKCLLFQPFKQSGEVFKPARVNFQIKQVTVSIEEFVGRKGANAKIALDSCLLFIGQETARNHRIVGSFAVNLY